MRPNSVAKEPDPYVFVYPGIPGNHLVLKNVPNYEFCHAKRFPGEGPAFCCRRGALVYLYQKCPMNFDICSPVKQIAKTNKGGQKNIVQRDVQEL